MVRQSWKVACIAVLALLLACATGTWNQAATLPEGGDRTWTLPLLSPLIRSNPTLWVRLRSGDAKVELPIIVDSGAAFTTLPSHVIDELGLEEAERSRVRVRDARGVEHPWRGAIVPRAEIGDLVLTDAPFFASGVALLGADVLSQRPWSIDASRGVMVVGAPPLESPDLDTVELGSRRWRDLHVDVKVNGHDVLLYLDTGASDTAIDQDVGIDLGLPRRELDPPRRVHAVHGTMLLHHVHPVNVELGGRGFSGLEVTPLPSLEDGGALNQKIVGLLGMDVLGRHRFRVEWGSKLELAPRAPLLASARARVGRWDWVPETCDQPGCVTLAHRSTEVDRQPTEDTAERGTSEADADTDAAHSQAGEQPEADPEGNDEMGVPLILRTSRNYERPVSFLFGCVTEEGSLHDMIPWIEVLLSSLTVEDSATWTTTTDSRSPFGRVFARHAKAQCDSFALLDVNPVPEPTGSQIGDGAILRYIPTHERWRPTARR